MLRKLKDKKATLEAKKAALLSEVDRVDKKIAIVDEMIADESSTNEEAEKSTIEFSSVGRSSF